MASGFQESCVAQAVPSEFMDAIVAGSLELRARVWRDYLEGLLAARVPTESGTIDAPTLILVGERRPRSWPSRPPWRACPISQA